MTASNRFQLVDREHLHGTLAGIDFGYNLSCIVRSPEHLLLWSGGTMYTSGRQSVYGGSQPYLWERDPRHRTSLSGYIRLGQGGGRLSVDRITQAFTPIVAAFGEDSWGSITKAVRERKTLIVEGGGGQLCPSRRSGKSVLEAWRDNPNKADR